MRLHSRLLGLWLACGPVCGFGQVVNLDNDRVPMTELHGLVRFHTGDDPDGKLGWADPGLDDNREFRNGCLRSIGGNRDLNDPFLAQHRRLVLSCEWPEVTHRQKTVGTDRRAIPNLIRDSLMILIHV
jgi:hypothetical protein